MSKSRSWEVDRIALLFGALSSPQRLRIFLHLATCCDSRSCCEASTEGIRHCVGDLGRGLDLAASTVSHHIKELRRAGLLRVERNGQRIECWIVEDTVDLLAEFLDDAGRGVRTLGGHSCNPTEQTLPIPAAVKGPAAKPARAAGAGRPPRARAASRR
jgi:ArsR family transcriptional regulator, arsenate/arsenite/antimonite-responsive transcriptional repressor